MNSANMVRATESAKSRVQDALKRAQDIAEDSDKKRRLAAQECKACFYFSRIGGASMTSQACMCCGVEQMHSSTNTDALCIECAVKSKLCKHCGGDLGMVVRRKWPEPLHAIQG
jgi:hypothetical protein